MAVAQHDSFLPSKEEREAKENGRPPPFHIASLLSTSPPPEKCDDRELCAGTVHHKLVPGPSGSGEVLVDYSYPCQCGHAGKHILHDVHSELSCSVLFRTEPMETYPTYLQYAHAIRRHFVDIYIYPIFRSVMQLCVLPTGRFSYTTYSATSPHPCQPQLLSSFDLSHSLSASK